MLTFYKTVSPIIRNSNYAQNMQLNHQILN
jgi:hypothetical protein